MRIAEMSGKKLYRSKNGEFLGVCQGIADWRNLPVSTVRIVFIIIAVCTAVFPCLVIYLVAAFFMPINPYENEKEYRDQGTGRRQYYYKPEPDDFVNTSETFDDDKERYERMKKESDWDSRFSEENNK